MNEYIVTINEKKKSVIISNNSEVLIDKKKHHYEVVELTPNDFVLRIDNRVYEISALKKDSDQYSIFINGKVIDAVVRTGLQERASGLIEQSSEFKHKMEVKAPMPGMILKVKKKSGESVEKGDSIIILEAMKMENDIKSPFSGIIKDILATENNPVDKGAVLFIIE
jgi:biotin carboxyl carrier protein